MKAITTYLNFNGTCANAMKFYEKCFSAKLEMSPWEEAPGQAPSAEGRVMHARLTKGPEVLLMGSDSRPGLPPLVGTNFSIAVQCDTAEEIERLYAELGDGGKLTMPLQDTFWGARFGMLTDRFGIQWMFNLDLPKAA
jgi:PhnB protein